VRRRLALTVLAVTATVTIAFLVPLAAVVKTVATDRAISSADQEARALDGLLAAVTDPARLQVALGHLNARNQRLATVFLPDGVRVGPRASVPPRELAAARSGQAFTASSDDERRVWVPVRTSSGTVAVGLVRVPGVLLDHGVVRSWLLLGTVGLAVLVVATALADRLGASMVRSVEDLGAVTRRMQEGELSARVAPSGPPEIRQVGQAVNELARRIQERLIAERESVADLSHRLRTPLTGVQLEAERLRKGPSRDRVLGAVSALTDAVNNVIHQARLPAAQRSSAGQCDVRAVVRDRLAFWSVLAEDQDRHWSAQIDGPVVRAPVPAEDLGSAIDALIANIFAHTEDGTAFSVRLVDAPGTLTIVVADQGPGFPATHMARGRSGAGSTGLGLDISRQLAERAGGSMRIATSPDGGARVDLTVRAVRPGPGDARTDAAPFDHSPTSETGAETGSG
jgi:signal transduction histidine kinase